MEILGNTVADTVPHDENYYTIIEMDIAAVKITHVESIAGMPTITTAMTLMVIGTTAVLLIHHVHPLPAMLENINNIIANHARTKVVYGVLMRP